MGFFNDDPFDDFFEGFLGQNRTNQAGNVNPNRYSENNLGNNFIQSGENTYFVIDLPELEKVEVKINEENIQGHGKNKILKIVSSDKVHSYIIPKSIKTKKFDWTFNNGVLEVKFTK